MFDKPKEEHQWLDQLIGNWTTDSECQMPDGSSQKSTGVLKCRSLGGMWLLMDGSGTSPEGDEWSTMMTLGFDPEKDCYVGTFVASMMFRLWLYEGSVDGTHKKLVLDAEGPGFDGSGTARYQDSVEILDKDRWTLSSQVLDDSGNWVSFMKVHHQRSC